MAKWEVKCERSGYYSKHNLNMKGVCPLTEQSVQKKTHSAAYILGGTMGEVFEHALAQPDTVSGHVERGKRDPLKRYASKLQSRHQTNFLFVLFVLAGSEQSMVQIAEFESSFIVQTG
jgi:hypothetical protein